MNFAQQSSKRVLYGLILVLGLFWIWYSAPRGETNTGRLTVPQVGFVAPDFTLTTLDGQQVTLSALRGKVVLVNIWASWCAPCRAEMPAIEKTYLEYQDDGLVVLAVDSTVQDALVDVEAFVAEYGLTFPIPLDKNGEVTRMYRVQSLPTSFFIGRDGVIREVVIGGPMAEALLRSRVEELLKETR